jgi:hypothetical protein
MRKARQRERKRTHTERRATGMAYLKLLEARARRHMEIEQATLEWLFGKKDDYDESEHRELAEYLEAENPKGLLHEDELIDYHILLRQVGKTPH